MLYPPEGEILAKHIKMDLDGSYTFKYVRNAMNKFDLTPDELVDILWKLEGLTILFELEVAAGLI